MSTDLFEFIENCFTKDEPVLPDTGFKDIYMAIKFLSLYPGTFIIAQEANRFATKIPNWAVACYLYHSIPKGRPPKFAYPKAPEREWPKEILSAVIKNFNCSPDHAGQIIAILNKKDPAIIESMGVEVKKSGTGDREVSKQKRSRGSSR
jgi:hypothetical protein